MIYLVDIVMDIDEACINHMLFLVACDVRFLFKLCSCFVHKLLLPGYRWRIMQFWVLVGSKKPLIFLDLDLPSGLQVLVDLLVQARPVPDRPSDSSSMNEIERFAPLIQPLTLKIVNDESAIWWYPSGLDGVEIISCHLGIWKLVGKFYRPYPSPCAHVEHTLRVLRNG